MVKDQNNFMALAI